MSKSRLALFLLFCGLVVLPAHSPAPVVVRPGEAPTYVPPNQPPTPNSASAQAQFDNALGYEQAGQNAQAIDSYRKVVRRFPRSPLASNAQYKVGLLLEKTGDLEGAYKAYIKLNKDYPRSEDFNASIEGQMRVAEAYLKGRKQKVLGIPTLPSMNRAIDIYQSIMKNAPYSRFAPQAQFNIGRAKEKQAEYSGAIAAYQIVVDKYPTSDVADDAMFQIGYVYLTIIRVGSYDRNASRFAREYFEDFLSTYPKHEKAAQARQYLATLGNTQTRSSLKVAQYYDKQKIWRAAIMYYNEVVRQTPDSPDAAIAAARLDQLHKKLGETIFKDPMLTPGKPDPRRVAELSGRGAPPGSGPLSGPGGQPVSQLPPLAPGLDTPLPGEGSDGAPGLVPPGVDPGFDSSNPFDTPTSVAPGPRPSGSSRSESAPADEPATPPGAEATPPALNPPSR
jgi:outer membrane protein assembly factor BamD